MVGITVRLPAATLDAARALAGAQGVKVTTLVREWIEQRVAERAELTEQDDHSLVTAFGEIDLAVRHVAQELCQAVTDRRLPLVIDAAEVTFVDSAGMSVFVRMARDAEANEYSVVLRNAPWMLKELLTITGVDQLLPFAEGEPHPARPTAPPDTDAPGT